MPVTKAYAPAAIQALYNTVKASIPSAQMGGILEGGNPTTLWGYHPCFAEVAANDDSRQGSLNNPPADSHAASALDISLPTAQMKICTQRLLDAAKARDPWLAPIREFAGTIDGVHVVNYELKEHRQGIDEWDTSHLWHIHLSIYRHYSLDTAALQNVAHVIIGDELTPAEMDALAAKTADKVWAKVLPSLIDSTKKYTMEFFVRSINKDAFEAETAARKAAALPAPTAGEIALALKAILPPEQTGGLTQEDIERAMHSVLDGATVNSSTITASQP